MLFELPSTYSEKKSSEQSCAIRLKEDNVKIKEGDLNTEFYLPAAVDRGIKSGNNTVRVFPASCTWMGVTYKEDRESVRDAVRKMVEKGIYTSPLFEN